MRIFLLSIMREEIEFSYLEIRTEKPNACSDYSEGGNMLLLVLPTEKTRSPGGSCWVIV